MMQPAQDPNELFDIVTEDGQPTGIVKSRAQVHHDGDWHRAIHVWFWGIGPDGPNLLMNRRGKYKDTWPLALDATVGGHLGAGESITDAFREVHEEIGVHIDPTRFEWLFQHKRSSDDLLDREVQDIYLVRDDRPLTSFAPNLAELEGLVQVSITEAAALFRGDSTSATGRVLSAETDEVTVHTFASENLPMRDGDTYFVEVISSIEERIR